MILNSAMCQLDETRRFCVELAAFLIIQGKRFEMIIVVRAQIKELERNHQRGGTSRNGEQNIGSRAKTQDTRHKYGEAKR